MNDAHNTGRTILTQLGNGTLAMIGASNILLIEGGVQFKIGKNSKKVNHVAITLASDDTYTIKFGSLRKKRGDFVPSYTLKNEVDGVYVDSLHSTIETHTGLYTTL